MVISLAVVSRDTYRIGADRASRHRLLVPDACIACMATSPQSNGAACCAHVVYHAPVCDPDTHALTEAYWMR